MRDYLDQLTGINLNAAEMDKVTQTNAANAEESAPASEEMSAQSKQMKELVAELLVMVGGRSSSVASKSMKSPLNKSSARNGAPQLETAVNAVNKDKSNIIKNHQDQAKEAVHPEQLIPMDEDDFKDF